MKVGLVLHTGCSHASHLTSPKVSSVLDGVLLEKNRLRFSVRLVIFEWKHGSVPDSVASPPRGGRHTHLLFHCQQLFLISDENENGKMLALTVKKRRAAHNKTSWWSGVLEGDDKWEPQQP